MLHVPMFNYCHSKLVLHLLKNEQLMQVIIHQPRQTTLIFPGPCDQTSCSLSMTFFGTENETELQ